MARLFPTRNPLELEHRTMIVDDLNRHLADLADLYSLAKHAHWNVIGEEFFMWHGLFDTIAEGIEDYTDMVAERITALGGYAYGTLRMAARSSRLPEFPESVINGNQCVEVLLNAFALVSANLQASIEMCDEDCGDEVTSNMLQEICHQVDKSIYFLERHTMGGS